MDRANGEYKQTASGFIHGFRYNVRALSHILEHKYYGKPWPGRLISSDAASLTDYVITRVNTTSALWQQFGYLCDAIVLSEQAQPARCYTELPVDYVHDTALGRNHYYYTVTLEYGSYHVDDPFHIDRIHKSDSDNAHQSHFLHPIVRRFDNAQLVSEHHIIENLETAWHEDCHINPLMRYFQRELAIVHGYNKAA